MKTKKNMKKAFLVFALLLTTAIGAFGQVQFTKFKFAKDEPFGRYPGRKMLDTKFTVTSDKDLKYVLVDYYAVNGVGDVISGVTRGTKSDDEEFIKPKRFECTGPFKSGKNFSLWSSGVITNPRKDITAFPWQIQIMYMGTNEWVTIAITKENIKQFFPKVEWMEINRYNKVL